MKSAIISALLLMVTIAYAITDKSSTVEMASDAIEEIANALNEQMPVGGNREKRSTVVPVRQLSRTQFNRCQATAHGVACDSGLQQRLYTQALECQMNSVAEIAQYGCGLNDNGYYCSQALEIVTLYPQELQACTSLQFCSSGCRAALNLLNANFGCCSGYITNSFAGEQTVLSAELWQTCGVTPGPLCPIPTFNSIVSSTRFCTDEEFLLMAIQTRCMPENLERVINAQLNNTGCESLGVAQAELCAFNGPDNFCALMDTSSVMSAIGPCTAEIRGSSTCSSSCANALRGIRNQLGCCINSILNGTLARVSPVPNADLVLNFFSEDFWSRCNVDTPGMCESTVALNVTLVNGATKQAGGLSLAFLILFTAILGVFV